MGAHYADLPWVGGLTAGVIAHGQEATSKWDSSRFSFYHGGLREASPTSQ